jgi:hypothetical protein
MKDVVSLLTPWDQPNHAGVHNMQQCCPDPLFLRHRCLLAHAAMWQQVFPHLRVIVVAEDTRVLLCNITNIHWCLEASFSFSLAFWVLLGSNTSHARYVKESSNNKALQYCRSARLDQFMMHFSHFRCYTSKM